MHQPTEPKDPEIGKRLDQIVKFPERGHKEQVNLFRIWEEKPTLEEKVSKKNRGCLKIRNGKLGVGHGDASFGKRVGHPSVVTLVPSLPDKGGENWALNSS